MEVGSIVECIKEYNGIPFVANVIQLPIKGEIYTVREIFTAHGGHPSIRLEEMVIAYNSVTGKEMGARQDGFRELLPPQPIEELIGTALTDPIPQLINV